MLYLFNEFENNDVISVNYMLNNDNIIGFWKNKSETELKLLQK